LKKTLLVGLLLASASTVSSASLVNDMQTCQGLLAFMDKKLRASEGIYPAKDVKTVQQGLASYDRFIQNEIVSPGLLKFNAGNQAKADNMQQQVDAFKQSVVADLEKRYPKNRLFMDHVVALNNCTKKAVPSGPGLDQLKLTFDTLTTMLLKSAP